ncbi:acetoacetate--CoA ligase [Isoalcanivorax indicus]|uniref:acetoacetate--CoA ligase n=1 Tax=Isoalcanivorax indicus TaxID=2202653 RepID=UPI000DBA9426|nr:acetoacetate--CoA ligase [Isoalcanivorax indicus]
MADNLLWQPPADARTRTRLGQFWQQAEALSGERFADYEALHQWSLTAPEDFWGLVMRFSGLIVQGETTPHLSMPDGAATPMTRQRWYPHLTLNYAENLLRRRDNRVAMTAITEDGQRSTLTFAALHQQAGRVAAQLLAAGVRPGDRVAGWLPNRMETVIAALGCAWVGAVWSSCSPDFGVSGVTDRFGQIAPRLLFVTDGYFYNGKWQDLSDKVAQVRAQLAPEQVIQLSGGKQRLPETQDWDTWLLQAGTAPDFAQLPFDHPLYILYSSGTTGKPKCIVHGAGGTLLQQTKEHVLHGDLHDSDTLFYFTTCGWMMWNWLVGGLQTGAGIVLYDGNPAWPDAGRLFAVCQDEGITHFGTSAKFIQAVEKAGVTPGSQFDLSALRVLMSTGSPLLHESFDFIYREIKHDLLLSSISGGTDIISCFALGNPLLPVYRGELQCLGLGMDVAVFNDQGQPEEGEKGELVCRRPFPSMPVGFWQDDDGSRYHKAYFARFENIWAHGDYAEIRRHRGHRGLVIHGRSDAVLNPGGVRIGTAEIYRQVETLAAVRESIVVGQDWQGDVRVVLFVVLQAGHTLDDALCAEIRAAIRSGASPRHVPAVILEVPEIPRTVSGKIVELAVREVIHGRPVSNESALANPQALAHFRHRPELT